MPDCQPGCYSTTDKISCTSQPLRVSAFVFTLHLKRASTIYKLENILAEKNPCTTRFFTLFVALLINLSADFALGQQARDADREVLFADVEEWIQVATDGSPDQRLLAAYNLPAEADKRVVVETLIKLARNIQTEVRVAAIHSLGKINDRGSLSFLRERLNDRSPQVREASVWALNNARDLTAVQDVVPLLHDKSLFVRIAAHWYFVQTVPPGESRAVLVASLDDPDANIRAAAVWGLAGSPIESQRASAHRLFTDASRDVRLAAAWAFSEAMSSGSIAAFCRGIADSDKRVQRAMAWGLVALGDPGGQVALQLINGGQASWATAERDLGNECALNFLISLLRAEDAAVRRSAAATLGESGSVRGAASLAVLSSSSSVGDRIAAAIALADIDGVGILSKVLRVSWAVLSSFVGMAISAFIFVIVMFFVLWHSGREDAQTY